MKLPIKAEIGRKISEPTPVAIAPIRPRPRNERMVITIASASAMTTTNINGRCRPPHALQSLDEFHLLEQRPAE